MRLNSVSVSRAGFGTVPHLDKSGANIGRQLEINNNLQDSSQVCISAEKFMSRFESKLCSKTLHEVVVFYVRRG